MTNRVLRPKKAEEKILRPNLLIYGDSGAGKTLTALQLAKLTGARCLVIDGDKGTDDYGGQFDFDVIQTDSPVELEAQLDYYLEHPEGYTMFVVDPISVFHTNLESMADADVRKTKQQVSRFSPVLDPGTRAIIKRLNKITAAKMRRLDMALVVTARSKPKYKAVASGGKLRSLEQVGTTWDGDNTLDYEFRATIEIVKMGNRRIGRWDKTRGVAHPDIEADNPLVFAEKLLPYVGRAGFTAESTPDPVVTEAQAERINQLVRELNLEQGVLTGLLDRAGASCVEDLPRGAGEAIIQRMEADLAQKGTP